MASTARLLAWATVISMLLIGCSGSQEVTDSMTCAEFVAVDVETRQIGIEQLADEYGAVQAYEPYFAGNFESVCRNHPDDTVGAVLTEWVEDGG